ncbi:substrate-binding domain-containing protein [Sorangium sp. So ce726]|uniref:protein kinase domain-containing protein n=1 Tax=Sorangium sp. So ce726 TaxID=3133319 RepID=UPI003F5F61A1
MTPGTIIAGRYRIVHPLGEGGMGAVLVVEHIETKARRAMKVMLPHLVQDPRLRERFAQEARIGASIKSDHVVEVMDAGVDEQTGTPFLVMELLEGESLDCAVQKRGAFSPAQVADLFEQLCHAVGAAHEIGVVHRDLKPENIFLAIPRTTGVELTVKVLDFGIARLIAASRKFTGPAGTSYWMAPEQTLHNAVVGPSADVWALGLLAFHMLTGRYYWKSTDDESIEVLMREMLVDDLVPPSLRSGETLLPEGFDEWFARCVCRTPGQRYSTASEAYAALSPLLRVAAPASSISPPASSRRTAPAALAIPAELARDVPQRLPSPRAHQDGSAWPGPLSDPPPSGEPAQRPPASVTSPPVNRPTPIPPQGPTPPSPKRSVVPVAVAAAVGAVAVAVVLLAILFVRAPRAGDRHATPSGTPSDLTQVILRIHGSNTIGAELMPALVEAFLEKKGATSITRVLGDKEIKMTGAIPGILGSQVIEIASKGSGTAFDDLRDGKCDIGMASRRIKADEEAELTKLGPMTSKDCEHVLGLDGVAIITHRTNPVTMFSLDDLSKIFSGDARRWSDVGSALPGEIKIHARDDKSGTWDTVKDVVLKGRPLLPEAQRHDSNEAVDTAVAADTNGIGFEGLTAVRRTKPVDIRDGDSPPVAPSSVDVSLERYSLTHRLYLYSAKDPRNPWVADFIRFALSPEGQHVVKRSGFVQLDAMPVESMAACLDCTPEYKEVTRGAIRLKLDFRFGFQPNAIRLDSRGSEDINRVIEAMKAPNNKGKKIVLIGFSDNVGDAAHNRTLSLKRAEAVDRELQARGQPPSDVKGLGEDMPIASNSTEDGRQKNRRVEIWIR